MKKISENEIEIDGVNYSRVKMTTLLCDGCEIERDGKCGELEEGLCYMSIWVRCQQSSFNDLITRNYATVEKRGQLSDDAGKLITKIKEEFE